MSDKRFQLAVPNAIYALILFAGSIVSSVGIWFFAKQQELDTSSLFLTLIHLTILIVFLLYTPATLRGVWEWIGWMFLCFTEWFYYEPIFNSILKRLGEIVPDISSAVENVINIQHHAWELCRSIGPIGWPYNIALSFWPIYILGLGLVLRAGIYRWGGARLMVHARAYWLWITLYLIMLLVFASVSPWNFYLLLGVTLAIAALLLAGASQVASDILMLLWGYLRAGYRIVNILCRWAVFSALLLTDRLRRVIKRIRVWYQRYVTEPLRHAVQWIDGIAEGWKEHVVKKTDELDKKADDL